MHGVLRFQNCVLLFYRRVGVVVTPCPRIVLEYATRGKYQIYPGRKCIYDYFHACMFQDLCYPGRKLIYVAVTCCRFLELLSVLFPHQLPGVNSGSASSASFPPLSRQLFCSSLLLSLNATSPVTNLFIFISGQFFVHRTSL